MSVERNLLISLLKLAKNGVALTENVKNDSKLPFVTMLDLLEKLQTENLLKVNGNIVEVDGENRLKLAVKAISLGADVQVVSSFLHWQEFESMAATALRNNGFVVCQNLRFKHGARRCEIDVVGCKKPLVVCIDCKDWHKALSSSSIRRIAEAQTERVRALVDVLPSVFMSLDCVKWEKAKFIPVILVLLPCRSKFCDDVPVVPVLQLQDFIHQLPLEVESLKYFQKEFVNLSHHFQDGSAGKTESRN
jgi:Holliday junction resolvase-like predicted endonuclease